MQIARDPCPKHLRTVLIICCIRKETYCHSWCFLVGLAAWLNQIPKNSPSPNPTNLEDAALVDTAPTA